MENEKNLKLREVLEPSLISVSLLQSLVYLFNKFIILESPSRNGEEGRRRLRNKSFDNEFWSNKFKEINDFINIFKGLIEVKMFRMIGIFFCHFCSLDELQLMDFQSIERKVGNVFCLLLKIVWNGMCEG